MKGSRRVIGWIAVACGAAFVLLGAMPIFQGIHLEGVFIGLAAFIGGAWVLVGPEVRRSFRQLVGVWARQGRRDRSEREARRGAESAADPLLAVRILRLAREHGGLLTLAQVAMELNVPLQSAEAGLEECVRAGNALADYDIAHSHPVYRFPEFAPPQVDTDGDGR